MTADDTARSLGEAFRSYIEDMVAIDDRYGPPIRSAPSHDILAATRFEVGRDCWMEVAVLPAPPTVRVGFATNNPETGAELEQIIRESDQTAEGFLHAAFSEAGLDSTEAVIQTAAEGAMQYITTLSLDELADLEQSEVRDTTLRVLEGYLIAFGPALVVEEEE